ncbi:MAG: hypothetical protein LBH97_01505 [Treponema sp.]|nr:hypothetical protein [Treponema sp.]
MLVVIGALLSVLMAACANGTARSGSGEIVIAEKITVAGGSLPVYRFTLPEGTIFRDYTGITGQFLLDEDNYGKTARVRAYGNYPVELFLQKGNLIFIDFSSGENDKNAPYLVSNVYGSNTAIDTISSGAGPDTWFTLDFPLDGKRYQTYNPANFPNDNASGDFYFALGPGTADAGASLTYYARDIALVSADGTRKVFAQESGFEKPAFAGYTTALAQLRREQSTIVEKKAPPVEQGGPAAITVNTATRYQQVRGFGGMSNAWTSPVITENDITTMYGENGLGYNIFRIIIYHEPARWGELLAVARKAQSYGATIVASPWTPPVQLKSVNSHIGGHLQPEHYAGYAAHLRSFVRYMADNGVRIDAISFQNEPDIQVSYDSCDWTSRQMLEFVKGYGREIGDVKIIPGESFQFRRNFTDPMLNDSDALKNFDIIGGHIYGGGLLAYPLAAQKGKEVWMTEHLLNTQGNFPNDLTWRSAMTVAKEIHDCMNANFNVYLWWYLKRFYSMIGDGEYGAAEGQVLRRGYVMSHYAKYATGKQRVEAQVDGNRNVYASAYDGGGSLTLVIVNMGTDSSDAAIQLPVKVTQASAVESVESGAMRPKSVRLDSGGKTTARLTLAPQSIVSVRFE